jgi:nickel-type superoxide dismutase maturation protease
MILVRRVVGESMLPILSPGKIILGVSRRRAYRSGDVVIVLHDDREKIKRIARVKDSQIYVVGDNPSHSTDSRHFGWLPISAIQARVVWPRH